ncbi:hypothetical protein P7C70_g4072, partial [Phenoliferia sp. Uapishka_3]
MAITLPPLGLRAQPYALTSSSPSEITAAEISPKATLLLQDFDGQGKEFRLTAPCSKVAIFNSKNFTLRLQSKVLTSTLEVWKSSNVTILVDSTSSSLGTIQLDPTLSSVTLSFANSTLAGSIILSPSRNSGSFGFTDLKIAIDGQSPVVLADEEGKLHEPQDPKTILVPGRDSQSVPEQWVVKYGEHGWRADTLARGAKEYPVLNP